MCLSVFPLGIVKKTCVLISFAFLLDSKNCLCILKVSPIAKVCVLKNIFYLCMACLFKMLIVIKSNLSFLFPFPFLKIFLLFYPRTSWLIQGHKELVG